VSTGIGFDLAFGTYEDARRMVGVRTERRFAGTAVSAARIQHFAAMIQDANASYWDEDFATRVWGGLVAPPAPPTTIAELPAICTWFPLLQLALSC